MLNQVLGFKSSFVQKYAEAMEEQAAAAQQPEQGAAPEQMPPDQMPQEQMPPQQMAPQQGPSEEEMMAMLQQQGAGQSQGINADVASQLISNQILADQIVAAALQDPNMLAGVTSQAADPGVGQAIAQQGDDRNPLVQGLKRSRRARHGKRVQGYVDLGVSRQVML